MSLRIYDIAETLKRKYKTSDPYEIAEYLGIFVSIRPLGRLKGFYGIMNRERHIVINADLDAEDRRVVCAHELGHDRLHRSFARYAVLRDIMLYDMSSKPEYEANIFAADLLVGDREIVELAPGRDHMEIGGILQVNPNIITFKLVSMKNRGYEFNISQRIDSSFLGTR